MRRHSAVFALFALALNSVLALPISSQEDVRSGAPTFEEGDVLGFDQVDSLRPFLPPEFWENRDFFFYEGMQLEIGPPHYDYSPAEAFEAATERFRGQPRLGPEGSLENYVAGLPFPDTIDCKGDPDAGTKIIWNFDRQWTGDGGHSSYYYSYWDRGEELPLYFEGTAEIIRLSNRVEPEHLNARGGDLFRGEKRKGAFGVEVDGPFDARGIALMTYRYKDSDKPKARTKNDDTWVYLPALRRVRRISSAQRTDSVSGTDFTFDDLSSFAGVVPQYRWECIGEMDLIAPTNTKVAAYPYKKDHNFGPYGLSYASDRWELRHAVKIRFTPNDAGHPYHHKDIYLDQQTLTPLYSFAYDRKGELWKIIWHNNRWSEDNLSEDQSAWYAGWEGVEKPRDLHLVSDTIVNVQTGTGTRIEFWDAHGTPFENPGKTRRYIDIGRLTKGR